MVEDFEELDEEDTVVEPHEAAIIMDEGGFRLLIPKSKDDEEVPDYVLAIVALAIRLKDQSWVQSLAEECRKDMEQQQASRH